MSHQVLQNILETEHEYSKELQELFDADNPFAFLLQHPKTYAYRTDTLESAPYNDLCKIQLCDLKAK